MSKHRNKSVEMLKGVTGGVTISVPEQGSPSWWDRVFKQKASMKPINIAEADRLTDGKFSEHFANNPPAEPSFTLSDADLTTWRGMDLMGPRADPEVMADWAAALSPDNNQQQKDKDAT